jgi:hypothetical protein
MKANELRIGNYVNYESEIKQISGITSNNDVFYVGDSAPEDLGEFESIPLTEEWLIKFGFESVGFGGNRFVLYNAIDGTSNFVIETDGIILYPQIDYDIVCWSEFKYVHQLQNLYFALTGEELILNE